MFALIAMIILSVVALFAIGQSVGADHDRSSVGIGRSIQRGFHALMSVGASWRPVEHLRG